MKKVKPALLGEGSYGCVFEPPIQCTSPVVPLGKKVPKGQIPVQEAKPEKPEKARGRKPRTVGKLFTDTESFRNELKLTRVAMDAVSGDRDGSLLLPKGYCRTSLYQVERHPSHLECESLYDLSYKLAQTGKRRSTTTLYQLLMPYGGARMDRYIKKEAKKAPFPADRLLRMLMPLVEGLLDISRRGYSHQDIKTGNMLVMPEGKLILIDYGLMIAKKDMYLLKNASRLRYTYFPYPPEFKVVSYLARGRCCDPLPEVYKNLEHLGLERRNTYLSLHPAKKIQADIQALYQDLIAVGKSGIPRVLGPYADRVDIYSLGMALVDLWRYLEVNRGLKEIVAGMTEPDPRKRWNAEELLDRLERYFMPKR